MPYPRIASLLASATEIAYGIGLGEAVVAVSHECDFPADALSKPKVTFSHVGAENSSQAIDDQVKDLLARGAPLYEVDAERLVALAPDIIITQAQCDVCAVDYDDVMALVDQQSALRDTQVVALNPQSLDDIFRDVVQVGQATGQVAAAERYRQLLETRTKRIQRATETLPAEQRPRVACIEWIDPLMLSANWMPRLVEIAGGRHDLTQDGRHSSYTSWDAVAEYDPEVVVVMPCGFDLARTVSEAESLSKVDCFRQLTAVKNGRVFAVDGNAYFNRSGPRIVDSLEILAHLLHPDLVDDPGVVGCKELKP